MPTLDGAAAAELEPTSLVRLMVQAMDGLGYSAAARQLEAESGVLLEPREVSALRRSLAAGDWPAVEALLPQLVRDYQVLRLKGRLWLSGKALPLQIQMVGPRLNSWFEASPPTAWTPDSGGGADLVVLSLRSDAADVIRSSLQRLMQATPATANPAATTPRG